MLVRADGRLGREGRLLRTLVGLVVLAGTLALAPRAFAAGEGTATPGTDITDPTRPYVVADGDTLWAIAAAVEPGTPRDEAVAAIMRLNSMSTASLRPGEQILVPVDSRTAPAES